MRLTLMNRYHENEVESVICKNHQLFCSGFRMLKYISVFHHNLPFIQSPPHLAVVHLWETLVDFMHRTSTHVLQTNSPTDIYCSQDYHTWWFEILHRHHPVCTKLVIRFIVIWRLLLIEKRTKSYMYNMYTIKYIFFRLDLHFSNILLLTWLLCFLYHLHWQCFFVPLWWSLSASCCNKEP